tara:strand:+ start:776 stop:916 length:141 start_codon:yes stop_codon:yes gene_type:complete
LSGGSFNDDWRCFRGDILGAGTSGKAALAALARPVVAVAGFARPSE